MGAALGLPDDLGLTSFSDGDAQLHRCTTRSLHASSTVVGYAIAASWGFCDLDSSRGPLQCRMVRATHSTMADAAELCSQGTCAHAV